MKWWQYGLRAVHLTDNFCERLVKRVLFGWIHTHRLSGECLQCGDCCEQIGVGYSYHWEITHWIPRLIIRWFELIYPFHFIGFLEKENVMVFTCTEFDGETRKCRSHKWRPAICRNYPLVKYFKRPDIFMHCGYAYDASGPEAPADPQS